MNFNAVLQNSKKKKKTEYYIEDKFKRPFFFQ